MKPIAACLPSNVSAQTSKPLSAVTPNPLAASPLRTLWLRMAEIYGHRWTTSYGDDPERGAGGTWAKGLAGVTPAQLASGLAACIASADPWPPTLPEFRARCLGIPPLAAVRLDSAQADGFTRLVWQHLDGYRYKQAAADQSDRMLREAYELARQHVMRGGELPAPSAELEDPKRRKPVPARPEVAAAAMDAIRKDLALEAATS